MYANLTTWGGSKPNESTASTKHFAASFADFQYMVV